MKIYKCDNKWCTQEQPDVDSWITIGTGTELNNLFITNNTYFKGIISLGRHSDIHFCSAKCCIRFLFGDELAVTAVTPISSEEQPTNETEDKC